MVTEAKLATSTVQVAIYIFLIGFITRVQNCLRIFIASYLKWDLIFIGQLQVFKTSNKV